MSTRAIQHENGDIAVTSVKLIWNEIGAAADEIHHDYGEDLLIQTRFDGGRMDASRLWVQVKGRSDVNEKSGKYIVPVCADTVLRWVRGADLLVLVLWDIPNKRGWYVVPSYATLHSELAAKRGRDISISIDLNSEAVFDADAAELLAWLARQEHLARFIRSFSVLEKELNAWGDAQGAAWARDALIEAAIDGMVDLRIVDRLENEVQMREEFREMVMYHFFQIATTESGREEDRKDDDVSETVHAAILRSIVCMVGEISGLRTDLSLLTLMADLVMTLMKPTIRAAVESPDIPKHSMIRIRYPFPAKGAR